MNTKEKVLSNSLDMFADKGFEAVSVRDIAGASQLRESSLYYYFKSKQDILDTLTNEFEERSDILLRPLAEAVNAVITVDPKTYYFIAACYISDYLTDEKIRKFIRVLSIEQCHDMWLREVYQRRLYDSPMEYYEKIFEGMKEAGFLRSSDLRHMTMCFYSPVLYYFQKHLMYDSVTEVQLEVFREDVQHHFMCFLDEFSSIRRIPV